MLRRGLGLAALPALLALLPLVACGADVEPAPAAGTTGPDGGPASGKGADGGGSAASGPDGSWPGTETFPGADGDPCRGLPLPDADHYVAPGLCARLVGVSGLSGIRQIQFTASGDLFAATAGGTILLLRDANKDGVFQKSEVHPWGTTLGNGNNAHVDAAGGFVYAGGDTGVKRFAYDPAAEKGGPAEDVVINQPSGGHSKHTVHVYDGFLYLHSGSSNNASHESDGPMGEYDKTRSLIKRFDLSKLQPGKPFDWKDGEPFTLGLRNANGFGRNETTKKIYAVVNGLDDISYAGKDVHNDNPGEQIVEVAKDKAYGYPFCFTAQRVENGAGVFDPGTQLVNALFPVAGHDDAWCAANSSRPAAFVQAHSAPLDITFFDRQASGALPEEWRGGAFVALHGSWDRNPATGYKVVWQPFNADGTAPQPTSTKDTTTFPYKTVFGGGTGTTPKDGKWSWNSPEAGDSPRPAGVAVNPIDGALYVTTDSPGALYRIGVKK